MRKMYALALVVSLLVPISLFTWSLSFSSEQLPPGSAGFQTCEGCHEEVVKNLEKTQMGRLFIKHPRSGAESLVCETCHGPGEAHAESDGASFTGMIRYAKDSPTPVQKRNEACLQCHQKKKLLFWEGSPHEMRDMACSSCHNVHKSVADPSNRNSLVRSTVEETCAQCHKKETAQQMRFSHHPLREGKMDCASCHNPHGTPSESLLRANTKNELCYTCHAEMRGPHLSEHPPVIEDCSNCHLSHGSNHEKLLKLPELRLCRQCHVNFHGLEFKTPGKGNVRRHLIRRSCTSCHFNVHGSNHASGNFFTR